jgi:hypothetical protein
VLSKFSGVLRMCADEQTPSCIGPKFNGIAARCCEKRLSMLMNVVLVILFLMLLGAIPTWPHSRTWGYYPSSGLGLIVLVLLFLILTGRA